VWERDGALWGAFIVECGDHLGQMWGPCRLNVRTSSLTCLPDATGISHSTEFTSFKSLGFFRDATVASSPQYDIAVTCDLSPSMNPRRGSAVTGLSRDDRRSGKEKGTR